MMLLRVRRASRRPPASPERVPKHRLEEWKAVTSRFLANEFSRGHRSESRTSCGMVQLDRVSGDSFRSRRNIIPTRMQARGRVALACALGWCAAVLPAAEPCPLCVSSRPRGAAREARHDAILAESSSLGPPHAPASRPASLAPERLLRTTSRQTANRKRIGRVGQWSVAERNPPSGNQFGGLRFADPPYELQPFWPCGGSLIKNV